MRHPPFAFAEDIDQDMGDPHDPGSAVSYGGSADLDRNDEFPERACAFLDRRGVPDLYVPARHGGKLESHESLLMLVRMLARRDFTVAVAHFKTFLGAVCAWVGGSREQADELGRRIVAGDPVALALTEPDHGADLLAGDVRAEPLPEGRHRITGRKWLINNGTRSRLMCVLARTAEKGDPRGFSVFLVDKDALGPGSHTHLPKVSTHGMRGADISGFDLTGAVVGPESLVGMQGAGLEIVLKGMQLTRTLCAAPSLGVADNALRVATGFARTHRLYDTPLIALPKARRTLCTAYADLLAAEAVSLVSARSIHTLTGEMSVVSSVVKAWVPTVLDAAISSLGQVLGGRALLTEDFAQGRFQKAQRDHRIISIFDGSTQVNLNALINQFGGLARGHRRGAAAPEGARVAATLHAPLPEFDPERLSLASRGGSSLLGGLSPASEELAALAERGTVPASVAAIAAELSGTADDLVERMARHRPSARDVSADAFISAEHYTLCYAAAACVQLWLRNHESAARGPDGGLWKDAVWLEAVLTRLGTALGLKPRAGGGAAIDRLAEHLESQSEQGRLFSLLPCRLTGEEGKGDDER